MKKVNDMGSEVVEGFKCKPKNFDKNRPIMHYKTHIFVCDGERCKNSYKIDNHIDFLRGLIKELKFNKGKNRIKISRGGCFGACRFRAVINIYENSKANGFMPNSDIWLKKVNKFDKQDWEKVFVSLTSNKKLVNLLKSEQFIEMKIYGD